MRLHSKIWLMMLLLLVAIYFIFCTYMIVKNFPSEKTPQVINVSGIYNIENHGKSGIVTFLDKKSVGIGWDAFALADTEGPIPKQNNLTAHADIYVITGVLNDLWSLKHIKFSNGQEYKYEPPNNSSYLISSLFTVCIGLLWVSLFLIIPVIFSQEFRVDLLEFKDILKS